MPPKNRSIRLSQVHKRSQFCFRMGGNRVLLLPDKKTVENFSKSQPLVRGGVVCTVLAVGPDVNTAVPGLRVMVSEYVMKKVPEKDAFVAREEDLFSVV